MVAGREEGIWRMYAANSAGTRVKVFEARSEVVGAAGAISLPSEMNFMPVGAKFAPAGGKLIYTFQSDATDITDSTDHTITQLPVTLMHPDGRSELRYLNGFEINNSDTAGNDKFQNVTLQANTEVDVGEFVVPSDIVKATHGGAKMFAVLFDDTA